ncbi:MAG TPA: endolytic transglycosylase MltG [Marinospirillum sp.]|uniref:endolytic transglycosylase MltG n=1 Tax=Marinospirillum sp. TaxID=2183934 RepID=UPI002B479C97|nr:endolytic transglycosylase MltG [Marinospirillum sp.]HKM15073.1 endolytic transglycosylase MltG [Marinospirillum sp.]
MIKKIALALMLITLLLVAVTAYWFQQQLNQPLRLEAPRLLDIASGRTFISLLNQLEQEGVIGSSLPTRIWLRLTGDSGVIHTGEYQLTASLTLPQLYKKLQAGDLVTYRLTLVEGSTFKAMRDSLAAAEKLTKTTKSWSEAEIMTALGMPDQAAEGWFFPDTYTYSKGMQDLDLMRLANRTMQQLLADVWENRAADLPYKTPYEALIMASIVERETGVPHEREAIAGVFVRRLQKGMRLQTDPTVIYGMDKNYQGKITRKNLRDPTPWNTYVIRGLPITPIALPSAAALKATVNPAAGNALYFVAKGDGSHQFSASLVEHNQAVQKYQLQRRADYRSSPAPVDEKNSSE